MLTKLTLEGYKSFRKLELELRPLNVLIGANGAGKSNLVSFFRLVTAIANSRLGRTVIEAGGANSFLRHGKKITSRIWTRIEFDSDYFEFELLPDSMDLLFIGEESTSNLKSHISSSTEIIDLKTIPLMRESFILETSLDEKLSSSTRNQMVSCLRSFQIFHLSDTSDTANIKNISRINDNLELRSDAENLAAILHKIHIQNPGVYQAIRDVIRSVAPYFDDFLLRPNPLNPDSIRLEWREQGSDRSEERRVGKEC